MDLRYMMLKDRFRFSYNPHTLIYDSEDALERAKEISVLLKELSLYSLNLNKLSRERAKAPIKNELLNIARACLENDAIYDAVRTQRKLPIKMVSSFTYKSNHFIEKWKDYILFYTILFSSDKYTELQCFLNVETRNADDFHPKAIELEQVDYTAFKKVKNATGVVFKPVGRSVFILTPYGDIYKIKPSKANTMEIGYMCSGSIKKEFNFYKYPVAASVILTIAASALFIFLFFQTSQTLVIDANGTIELEVNRWSKVIKVVPLNNNGDKISSDLKLFNSTEDTAIYLILKHGNESGIITDTTGISIFVSGSEGHKPDLEKVEAYALKNKIKVQINANGVEYEINSVK